MFHIDIIPKEIRDKYKIVWEMQMKDIIDMAADRGRYICKVKVLICGWKIQLTRLLFHAFLWLEEGTKNWNLLFAKKAQTSTPTFTIKPKMKRPMKLLMKNTKYVKCVHLK